MGSNEDDDDVDLSEISPNFHIAFGFSSTLSLGSHSEAFRIHTQLIHIRYQPMVPTFPPYRGVKLDPNRGQTHCESLRPDTSETMTT